MIIKNIPLSILLLFSSFQIILGLIVDSGNDLANLEKLPEYREYLGRIRGKNQDEIQHDSPLSNSHPLVEFPTLCKKPPQDGDLYGHMFCWAAFSLYALLILSLIIYQIRSILWFNFKIKDKNGDRLNQQNIERESAHSPKLSRLFSERQNPNPSAIPLIIGGQSGPT